MKKEEEKFYVKKEEKGGVKKEDEKGDVMFRASITLMVLLGVFNGVKLLVKLIGRPSEG